MRLIHVLTMLGMACAALTAFAIIADGYQIYPPPPGHPTALPYGLDLYFKQLLGRWGGIFFLRHFSLQPAFSSIIKPLAIPV
jgi:hypothetical protein